MGIKEIKKSTARAVANFFITKGLQENNPIDQLKLQKLVYYAYAWYIANYNEELFSEDIHAWPHGPVVPELWKEFRCFGRTPIDKPATEYDYKISGEAETVIPVIKTEKELLLLESVWNAYQAYSGVQLSSFTHEKTEPWSVIRKARYTLEDRPIIPPELIRDLFAQKINNAPDAQ